MRSFIVYLGEDEPLKIEGVEQLAKHLNVPVESIPTIRLWKYSVGPYTVFEPQS